MGCEVKGKKLDAGKIMWDLLPMGALEEIAKLYTFGTKKYASWNWYLGLSYSRCWAAMWRHSYSWWWKREDYDGESGCHHLAAVAFYALVLLTFILEGRTELDDRVKPYAKKKK